MRVSYIPEPPLILGGGARALDPKFGLLAHGPSGIGFSAEHRAIRVGAIGTPQALAHLRQFLRRLEDSIAIPPREGRERLWLVPFPGLRRGGPLRFHFELDPQSIEKIRPSEEEAALSSSDPKERVAACYRLYEEKFQDYAMTANADATLVLLPLSRRMFDRCQQNGRIAYERRVLGDFPHGTDVPLFDFHHAMKAVAAGHSLCCQLLKPDTLDLRTRQDPATSAWNLTSALYYKGTAHPWKLADIDAETCLVGISFYNEIRPDGAFVRASMAHVYMKEGESQVIRGAGVLRPSDPRQQSFHLTRDQARRLLSDVVTVFRRQHGKTPERLVVHKKAPYNEDELEGFGDAARDVPVCDFVHIQTAPGPRFLTSGHDYPTPRGVCIQSQDGRRAFLYTTGFVPALQTYPGADVPDPLYVHSVEGASSMEQLAGDILALTKLDWNSTEFATSEPVTLAVSEKVGNVLAETASRLRDPPQQYRYYM